MIGKILIGLGIGLVIVALYFASKALLERKSVPVKELNPQVVEQQ